MKHGLLVLMVTGCASEARLPVSYFAETTRVNDPGQVTITGVAGGGGSSNGSGYGGGGRVRVGIGNDQELGVQVAGISLDSPSEHCTFDCQPDENLRYTTHGKSALVSWKARRRSFAVIAGLGASAHAAVAGDPNPAGDYRGHSVNGSLAVIGERPLGRAVNLYVGVGAVFGVPIYLTAADRQNMEAKTVFGIDGGIGLETTLAKDVRLYTELGARAMFRDLELSATAIAGLSLTL